MSEIRANGIKHFYEFHGEGDGVPLVLIAGMGGASSFWAPQVAALSRHRRVLVYDQRGTGRSDRVLVHSIEQLADDLLRLLDALKISTVDLIGHSTGGAIALVISALHPKRVRSLVLYASVHRADGYRRRIWGLRKTILARLGPEIYAQTTSLFFYPPEYVAGHDDVLKAAEARSASSEISSPEIMTSRIDSILNFEFVEPLSHIQARTLVCCAQDDMLTPAYFSKEIASLIPGAQLTLLEKGGHAFSRSRPDEFNDMVLTFVNSPVSLTSMPN